MKIITLLLVACTTVLISGSTVQESLLIKAEWLIGTWENKTPRGSIYETWDKIGISEYAGMSYILKESDTVIFESIRLLEKSEGIFYIPRVEDQNEGLPIRFSLKSMTNKQFTFENLNHDFPQIISYTLIEKDSLVAEVSGVVNGQMRSQVFPMKRLN